jgi:formylglycine-generating enzyme required for sulfatase activity
MQNQEIRIFKFLAVPIPLGIAGAFIWAPFYFLREWDPHEYEDFETIFYKVGWMPTYVGLIVLALILYYFYISVPWFKFLWVHLVVWFFSLKNNPPNGMVCVPPGSFYYGIDKQREFLPGFFIDKYPVTNEEYKKFVDETNHNPPVHWTDGTYPSEKAVHPVTYVTWDDAISYCHWRGYVENRKIELPTEQQWEKAARGPFGNIFPWGNEFDAERCNVNARTNPEGDTNDVYKYWNGRSLYGCYDMCGNVWEWMISTYDPAKEVIVNKGGSYYFDKGHTPAWMRHHNESHSKYWDLGFRCVSPCR